MLATMSLQTLGVLALCATLVSLALFVFFHNRQAAENRRFALAALTIAGWIVCISFSLVAQTEDAIIRLGRLGFAFASMIPFSLLWMFDAFSTDSGRRLFPVTARFVVLVQGGAAAPSHSCHDCRSP